MILLTGMLISFALGGAVGGGVVLYVCWELMEELKEKVDRYEQIYGT